MVTHERSLLKLKRSVLKCLRPGIWLNDEVINLYILLLQVGKAQGLGCTAVFIGRGILEI